MMFSWCKNLLLSRKSTNVQPAVRPRRQRRLELEPLEDRLVLSLLGSEFQVNTQTAGDQETPVVASSPSAANAADVLHVAVWSEGAAIKGQRYNAAGDRVGSELTLATGLVVNSFDTKDVAMDGAGNFVLVWEDQKAGNNDILFAQFDSNGVLIRTGAVTDTPLTQESDPAVAVDADGDFVVSYTVERTAANQDIHAKVLRADGTLARSLIVAKARSTEEFSDVASTSDGRFAIAFNNNGRIMLRRYSAAGVLLRAHRIARINDDVRASYNPSLAMDDQGNAVVVWEDVVGTNFTFQARKVTSAGRMLSTVTVVSVSGSVAVVHSPVVAMDRSDGDFVVAYDAIPFRTRIVEVSSAGVVGSTFDLGTRRGFPRISIAGNDSYFVAYGAFPPNGPSDGAGRGVFGRFGLL